MKTGTEDWNKLVIQSQQMWKSSLNEGAPAPKRQKYDARVFIKRIVCFRKEEVQIKPGLVIGRNGSKLTLGYTVQIPKKVCFVATRRGLVSRGITDRNHATEQLKKPQQL